MKLPAPQDQLLREAFRIIQSEDLRNLKTNKDIEMGSTRLILKSPNGTRYALAVSNAGVLSAVAV